MPRPPPPAPAAYLLLLHSSIAGEAAPSSGPDEALAASRRRGTITHYSGAAHVTVPIDFSTFKAVGAVDPDGGRFLLGDHLGRLFVLSSSASAR